MKTNYLISSLVAAGLALAAVNAVADGDQPYHVTGAVGDMNLGDARDTRNDDVWWGVGIGKFFNDNFALDIEYDEFTGTFRGYDEAVPGSTYDKWVLKNWGVMGRYYFTDRQVRPFFGGGVGYLTHRNVMNSGDDLSTSLVAGIAGQIAKHWSARAQIQWRRDWDGQSMPGRTGYSDWIYSIALSFDFGGKEAPPPPPAAPPPPPPPPPAAKPNPDLDGDGVPNERDKCPNTRPGAVVDLDGCEVEAVIELEGVHFDFDKATLRPEGKAILDKAAGLLDSHPKVMVECAGHTDSVGSEAYNQGLSERRAQTVKAYLESKGVKATRLTAKGYGESQPVASNDTSEGRAKNRRVELIVISR